MQIPKGLRKPGTFIAVNGSKGVLRDILPLLQKLPDAALGLLPGDKLFGTGVLRRFAFCDMDAIAAKPNGYLFAVQVQALAAPVFPPQESGVFLGTFIHAIHGANAQKAVIRIAAGAQDMVNILLRQRKSGGLLALRYPLYLFLLRGEKT